MRGGAKLKGADHSMLSRASNPEALGFLSGEVSLASKPEELLIAIAHRCRKLIIIPLPSALTRFPLIETYQSYKHNAVDVVSLS